MGVRVMWRWRRLLGVERLGGMVRRFELRQREDVRKL